MLWTTRSAVAVRETVFSVALLRAAVPRPSGSEPVSCRYTGHASSQVFTLRTLPPRDRPGTPTAASARKYSAGVDDVAAGEVLLDRTPAEHREQGAGGHRRDQPRSDDHQDHAVHGAPPGRRAGEGRPNIARQSGGRSVPVPRSRSRAVAASAPMNSPPTTDSTSHPTSSHAHHATAPTSRRGGTRAGVARRFSGRRRTVRCRRVSSWSRRARRVRACRRPQLLTRQRRHRTPAGALPTGGGLRHGGAAGRQPRTQAGRLAPALLGAVAQRGHLGGI